MIVRPRPTTLVLLYALRGSVLPLIAPRLAVMLALSCAVAVLHQAHPGWFFSVGPAPFTLLGLGVSIFLGFRNNACYDRWWEGRKQWGALLAESRNLLRDITTLLPQGETRERAARRLPAFAAALRDQLRGTHPAHTARALLVDLARDLHAPLRDGVISDILYHQLSLRLDALTGIMTACERLHSTPLPFAYSLMLHRSVWLVCLMLPFGMVDTLGLATPLLTLMLAYAFLGLDALGEELETPFSTTHNALPLNALVRAVEISCAHALDEPAPPPLLPENYVLL
jgi:putative membrane protein